MKVAVDVHGPQRMNSNDFVDLRPCSPASTHFPLLHKKHQKKKYKLPQNFPVMFQLLRG